MDDVYLSDPLTSPLPLAESSKAALALLAELVGDSGHDELQYLSDRDDYSDHELNRGLKRHRSNIATTSSSSTRRQKRAKAAASEESSPQDSIPSLSDAPDPIQPLLPAPIPNPAQTGNTQDLSSSSLVDLSGTHDDGPSFTRMTSPALSSGIPRIVSQSSHDSMQPSQSTSTMPLTSLGNRKRKVTPLPAEVETVAQSPPVPLHSLRKASMTSGVSYNKVRGKENQSASPSPVKSVSPNKRRRVELGLLVSPVKQPDFQPGAKHKKQNDIEDSQRDEVVEETDVEELDDTPPMVIPDSQPLPAFGKPPSSRSSSKSDRSERSKARLTTYVEEERKRMPKFNQIDLASDLQISNMETTSPVDGEQNDLNAIRNSVSPQRNDRPAVIELAHVERSPSVEYVQDYDPPDWSAEALLALQPNTALYIVPPRTAAGSKLIDISPIRLPRREPQAGPLQSTSIRQPLQRTDRRRIRQSGGQTPPRPSFLPAKPLSSLSASKRWKGDNDDFKIPDLPPSLRSKRVETQPTFDDYTFDFGDAGSQADPPSSSSAAAMKPTKQARRERREQPSSERSRTSNHLNQQQASSPIRYATSTAPSSRRPSRHPDSRDLSVSVSRAPPRRYSTTFAANGKRAFATPSPPNTPPSSPKSRSSWLRGEAQGSRQGSPALSTTTAAGTQDKRATNSSRSRQQKPSLDKTPANKRTAMHARSPSTTKRPATPVKTDDLLNKLPKRRIKRKRAVTVESDNSEDEAEEEPDRSFDRDSWENSNSDDEARASDSEAGTDYDEPTLVRRVSRLPNANAKGRDGQTRKAKPANQAKSSRKKRKQPEKKESSSSDDLTKNEEFMKGRQQRLATYAELEDFDLDTELIV